MVLLDSTHEDVWLRFKDALPPAQWSEFEALTVTNQELLDAYPEAERWYTAPLADDATTGQVRQARANAPLRPMPLVVLAHGIPFASVIGIGEEGVSLVRAGPLRRRIGSRDEFWRHRRRRPECRIVQTRKIFARGANLLQGLLGGVLRRRQVHVGPAAGQSSPAAVGSLAHQQDACVAVEHCCPDVNLGVARSQPRRQSAPRSVRPARCCRRRTAAARAPVPEPSELRADIDALESWVDAVRKRRRQ